MEFRWRLLSSLLLASLVTIDAQEGPPEPNSIQLTVTDVLTRSFTVSWNHLSTPGYTSYRINLIEGGEKRNDVDVPLVSGTNIRKVISGRQPGSLYEINLFGLKGDTSTFIDSVIQYTVPLPPIEVTYRGVQGTRNIEVKWKPPAESGFNKFIVKYIVDGEQKRQVIENLGTSYTIADLEEGKTVTGLTVSTGAGSHEDHLLESVAVEALSLDLPEINFQVTKVGTNAFTLTWNDLSSNGFTAYEIILSKAGGNEKAFAVAAEAGKNPIQAITGLQPGEAYEVTINGNQLGNGIKLKNFTQYTAPLPPTNVTFARNEGTKTIVVTWAPSVGEVNKYIIDYTIGGVPKRAVVDKGNSSYTFTGLKDVKAIVILSVSAAVGADPEKLVNSIPAKVRDRNMHRVIAPLPPSNVTFFQPKGTKDLRITWTPPEGVVNKYIIVYTIDGERKQQVINGSESSFTFNNLKKGQVVKILSIISSAGSDPEHQLKSTAVVPRQIGETDYQSSGGTGYVVTPLPTLKLFIATTVVTFVIFL